MMITREATKYSGCLPTSKNQLEAAPNLQFHFGSILWVQPEFAREGSGFSIVPCLMHPQSRGSVSLRSSSPKDSPKIRMNYFQSEEDLQLLVEAIKISRTLANSGLFDELLGEEVAPTINLTSDEDIKAYIRQNCDSIYHPVGTCKMGTDPMAVVDPELLVHGVEGLRVVDASIMPTITTGNTNAPTIMIGEKAVDLIKGSKRVSQQASLKTESAF